MQIYLMPSHVPFWAGVNSAINIRFYKRNALNLKKGKNPVFNLRRFNIWNSNNEKKNFKCYILMRWWTEHHNHSSDPFRHCYHCMDIRVLHIFKIAKKIPCNFHTLHMASNGKILTLTKPKPSILVWYE